MQPCIPTNNHVPVLPALFVRKQEKVPYMYKTIARIIYEHKIPITSLYTYERYIKKLRIADLIVSTTPAVRLT